MVGKNAGNVTVGYADMARQLALLPTSRISSVVNALSSPVMAELQSNVAAMRAAFYRAVRLTAAIALPASAGIALVADDLVAALLGPKWLASVPLLRLMCVYAAVRAIDVLLPPVLFARKRQNFMFWYCLVQLLAVPAAAVVGGRGAAIPGVIIVFTPVLRGNGVHGEGDACRVGWVRCRARG